MANQQNIQKTTIPEESNQRAATTDPAETIEIKEIKRLKNEKKRIEDELELIRTDIRNARTASQNISPFLIEKHRLEQALDRIEALLRQYDPPSQDSTDTSGLSQIILSTACVRRKVSAQLNISR